MEQGKPKMSAGTPSPGLAMPGVRGARAQKKEGGGEENKTKKMQMPIVKLAVPLTVHGNHLICMH